MDTSYDEAANILKRANNHDLAANRKWQLSYMKKLTNFVIKTAENCDDIRTWLKSNNDFKPAQLLPGTVTEEFACSSVF